MSVHEKSTPLHIKLLQVEAGKSEFAIFCYEAAAHTELWREVKLLFKKDAEGIWVGQVEIRHLDCILSI